MLCKDGRCGRGSISESDLCEQITPEMKKMEEKLAKAAERKERARMKKVAQEKFDAAAEEQKFIR